MYSGRVGYSIIIDDGKVRTRRKISFDGEYHIILSSISPANSRRLDHGAGKDLSLEECSREQLEKEVSLLCYI